MINIKNKRNGLYGGINSFTSSAEKRESFTFFEIPLTAGYSFFENKKLNFGLSAGLIAAINNKKHEFVSRRWKKCIVGCSYQDENNYWPSYINAYKLLMIGYTVNTDFSIKINSGWQVFAAIGFKHYIINSFFDKPSEDYYMVPLEQPRGYSSFGLEDRNYSIGLNMGIFYSF